MGATEDRRPPGTRLVSRSRQRRPTARPADVPGLSARQAALRRLDAVLLDGEMLEDGAGTGTGAERAEARGLADLTLRRLGQIDDALNHFVQRPPKGTGRQILRLMAAELLFGGTPPHAAVDLGVRMTQTGKGAAKLSGLVNAVGRRIAEQGAEIIAAQDAARLNTPAWLSKRLMSDWGAETANAIAEAHLALPSHDLTVSNPADAAALAAETGAKILPTGSLRLPDRPQISALPGYEQGAWWVQDAAAAIPASLLPEPKGQRVLDLCAAPGGKTMQLAAAGAQVTAVDSSERRMERLGENLKRTNLEAVCDVSDALDFRSEAPFNAVLLDAPCSASGTIRRHPDLPHRTDGRGLSKLADLQTRLLDHAANLVAGGGCLIFCTCSIFKPEGEAQAAAFLSRHANFKTHPVTKAEGVPQAFLTDEGWVRTRPDLWPEHGGLDGFFIARFRRHS